MTEKEYLELANLLYPGAQDISFYLNKYPNRNISGEVTRLGPSPTGYLHIGQVYQSLIHRMLANSTNGIFYLRLEDTDNKREVENAGVIAYDMLVKLGLTPDEGYRGKLPEIGNYGPYKQSERIEIYNAFARELVKRGRAFPCFCKDSENLEEIKRKREEELSENDNLTEHDPCRDLTLEEIKENLKQGKKFALRLLSIGDSTKTHEFVDAIKGKKELRENARDDVLIKSNGIPVYAFAHVVDDTLMHTTIIVRGQEWYQSLPVHIELSRAFGFKPFKYAHTPNICVLDENGNKRKISKRKDSFADVRFFLNKGYPINAIIEYLLTLLNSDFELWRKNNPDLPYTKFPFSLKKIGVTNPLFDFMKLDNISKTIISRYTAMDVYDSAINWAHEWNKEDLKVLEENKDVLLKVLSIDRGGDRPRKDITYFSEILSLYDYVLPNFKLAEANIDNLDKDNVKNFINEYSKQFTQFADNSEWFDNLKQVASKFNFVDNKTYKQNPEMFAGNITDASKLVRLAITGRTDSPNLFEIMKILGVNECETRLNDFIIKIYWYYDIIVLKKSLNII